MIDEQVVDFKATEEFMQEVLQRISPEELGTILDELGEKSKRFQRTLSSEAINALEGHSLRRILRMMFGVRRRADRFLQTLGVEPLKAAIAELLYSEETVEQRFSNFCTALNRVSEWGEEIDLAGELLHYVFPERFWLWTRWMWNPRTRTGALRLLVTDGTTLNGATPGEVYGRVGEAVAYAEVTRQTLGFLSAMESRASVGSFLSDAYLACVYTLYLYTTLRVRMTKEFTKIIPEPPELVRRLLGTYAMEA